MKTFGCGHPRTPANTLGYACRECKRLRSSAYYAMNREHVIAQAVKYAAWRRAVS